MIHVLGLIYKLQNVMNRTNEKQDTSVIIANYLLQNLDKRESFSIKTIANDCNVSPASITRFAKELSYNGFVDLKTGLLETPLERIEMAIDIEAKFAASQPSFNAYTHDLIDRVSASLQSFGDSDELSYANLKEISELIRSKKRVVFFATQAPSNLLLQLQHQLLTFEKFSQFFPLHKDQLEAAKNLTKDDLVIFISINGSYVMQKDITFNILNSEATSILLTQNGHLKLSAGFDRIILLGENEDEITGKYKLMIYFESLIQVYYLTQEKMNP